MKNLAALSLVALLSQPVMAEVLVEDAYARAVPPGQMNSAAFVVLNNTGKQVAMISAQSSIAKNVELHNHIHENGVMAMRQVDQITLKANQRTELKPGGYHVMFIGLSNQLKAGQKIDLKLNFSDGTTKQLTVPVKHVMKGMKKHH